MRMEEMISRQGMTKEEFCEQRGITPEQLDADVRERTIQSLKEDSALAAYADHANYTLEAEDFYAIIPGDSIQDKAYKRRQIEPRRTSSANGRIRPQDQGVEGDYGERHDQAQGNRH